MLCNSECRTSEIAVTYLYNGVIHGARQKNGTQTNDFLPLQVFMTDRSSSRASRGRCCDANTGSGSWTPWFRDSVLCLPSSCRLTSTYSEECVTAPLARCMFVREVTVAREAAYVFLVEYPSGVSARQDPISDTWVHGEH